MFLPVIESTLEQKQVLPKLKTRAIKEFNKLFPAIQDIFIDGTECPTQCQKK